MEGGRERASERGREGVRVEYLAVVQLDEERPLQNPAQRLCVLVCFKFLPKERVQPKIVGSLRVPKTKQQKLERWQVKRRLTSTGVIVQKI